MPINVVILSPGDYSIVDNGIPGDNTSVIKNGDGTVVYTFVHPADSVTITVGAPGINLTVNITDSLGTANFTLGDLANPAASPDSVTIHRIETTGSVTIAANNTITEGGADFAADIIAGSVVLSAGSGVGTGIDAIETQTGALEAETTTGGINLSNFGSVQIGGVSGQVDGLNVATSGNIRFTAYGSILLGDTGSLSLATVQGGSTSSNIILTALGTDSDILANVDRDAMIALAGNITLSAGRDVAFGTIGVDFDNDVRASGSITINAGRDFLIDGFADLASDDFGVNTGGNVNITSGRNIHMRNLAGADASILAGGNAGAGINLATGFGGALILDAPTANALLSTSGDVNIFADRMLIGATSGIQATNGEVILRTATAGREILLGSGGDGAFALELSDAEVDRIFTPSLTIGSASAGAINAVGAFGPANAQNLTLISGTDITLASAMTVTQALSLIAGDNLFALATSAITSGTLTAWIDQFASDAGAGGSSIFSGAVTAGAISISGNAQADNLGGTTGSDVINGNAGNDTIQGGQGFDTLNGGDGHDIIFGGGDNTDELVHGNGGNDTITSTGEGQYFGDAGNDLIFAGLSSGAFQKVLDGGDGIDTLDTTSYVGSYQIDLVTGVTNFTYETFVNFENVITGLGNDTITGTDGANVIQSGAGIDGITGLGGDDTLSGGDGDDVISGGTGSDFIDGGIGNDSIQGNDGADTILASLGNDTVNGGIGSDSIDGSTGDDSLAGGNLADTISGGSENDTISGGLGLDMLTGDDGHDVINGDAGADTILGGLGNDTLNGGNQSDTLNGGDGDDVITGSLARDVSTGGTGADTFVYNVNDFGTGLRAGADRITDFSHAEADRIDLSLIDASTTAAGNNAFSFIGTAAFVNDGVGGKLRFVQVTGNTFVEGDRNGDGVADFAIQLDGLISLVSADFIL